MEEQLQPGTILEQTEEFTLSLELDSDNELCYQVKNKVTGVVEAQTEILAQAYKYLQELQVALVAIRDMFKEKDKVIDTSKVVTLNPKKKH